MQRKQRILVIERYDDGLANYRRQIDHGANEVYYILTPSGFRSPGVDHDRAAGWRILDSFEASKVLWTANAFALSCGGFDRVIAMAERDLSVAAQIRSHWGVPGMEPATVSKVVDKVSMKECVRHAGLAIPRYRRVETLAGLHAWAEEFGYPFIAKPRRQAGSRGVHLFRGPDDLETVAEQNWADYEVGDFIPGPIYHVDGLVRQGLLWLCQPSRYLGTCLKFSQGEALGSVMVDDPRLVSRLRHFTAQCLQALELDDSPFHLEVIQNDGSLEPARRGEFVFLEIGARVGGGPIPVLYRDLYGLGLVDEWLGLQLDRPAPAAPMLRELGGFLMVPEPREVPCEVISAPSLLGRVAGLFREMLPARGEILDGRGGYLHISGTFLFRGHSSAALERSISQARELYALKTVPLLETCSA